jgi:rhodanese-related sulfurtransferase
VRAVRVSGQEIPASLVLVATGIRPEVALAQAAGVATGPTGAIVVDEYLRTSVADIFAAGDCTEKRHAVHGGPCWLPLGSTANREGRVAGTNAVLGPVDTFPGVAGALVMRFFDYTVARVGLGEEEALRCGFDAVSCLVVSVDKPHFMQGAKPLVLKLVADRKTRRLLGAHGAGRGDVARRIDATVGPLMAAMTVDQIANLDLLYAPPYAPPMDPVQVAANALRNRLDDVARGISARDYDERRASLCLVDVRSPAEVGSLPFPADHAIPLGALRARGAELPTDRTVVVLCKIGARGYEGQRILEGLGFGDVAFLEGGIVGWPFAEKR